MAEILLKHFSEAGEDAVFIGFCVMRQGEIKIAKNDKAYADIVLFDGVQEMRGKIWDMNGTLPPNNSIIKVRGSVGSYQGTPQMTVSQWRPTNEGEADPADFLPVYQGDRQMLLVELNGYVQMIENEQLRDAVSDLLGQYMEKFYHAPAAKKHHHAYLGGLLEHTVSVTRIALFLFNQRPEVLNLDIILAGAILHDIGKIYAYSWDGAAIDMTNRGKLVDHILMGMAMVQPVLNYYRVSEELQEGVLHALASHHGLKEWNSPVEPQTKEAMIVHLADLSDARIMA